MDLRGDDLAGVVDLFGGLTRGELGDALAELAFKEGEEHDPDAFEELIDDAIEAYELVSLPPSWVEAAVSEPLLVAGPVAFPTLPENGSDLRHILDVQERDIDRERAGSAAADRLHEAAVDCLDAGDDEEIERLLDLSYDIETWAPVDLSRTRELLDNEL